MMTDDRHEMSTDAKWWQKLRWPFVSGDLIKKNKKKKNKIKKKTRKINKQNQTQK